jgi:enamine deaminase RidA (YjgF/YER057c/UK114 family)
MSAERRLRELGLVLPPARKDQDNRVRALRSGNTIYLSGQSGPLGDDGRLLMAGKLGRELTAAQGAEASRLVGLACLSTLRGQVGDLDCVAQVVRQLGFFNCTPGYGELPAAMDGFTDLMVAVFGERGRSTRSCIGVPELQGGAPVEIEVQFEIRD